MNREQAGRPMLANLYLFVLNGILVTMVHLKRKFCHLQSSNYYFYWYS